MSEDSAAGRLENFISANRREFIGGISGAFLALSARNAAANDENERETAAKSSSPIDFLKNYPTSLLESAIYLLQGTHDGIALTAPGLVRQTAQTERLVGYAATSVFSTDADDARGRRANLDYWNYVFGEPAPKIAVSLDASKNPGSGSSWGRQNAHIHKGLNCRGVLTNGGVRDIDVFRQNDLQVFSGSLTVGHGNPHFIDFGKPVTIYGAKISSGDVVCADEHGAIVVAAAHLPVIEEAVGETLRRVRLVADYCRSKDFSPAGLAEVIKKLKPAAPWKPTR